MGEELHQPTPAKNLRGKSTFTAYIDDTLTVRMRKLDMVTLMMYDIMPLSMLGATEEFKRLKEGKEDPEVVEAAAEKMLKDTQKRDDFVLFLKKFACAAVISPVIVMEDDGNENHVPVTDLGMEQLLGIWNAHPDGKEEVQVMTPEASYEFRGPAQAAPPNDVHDGEDFRPEAEFVALPDKDVIHA